MSLTVTVTDDQTGDTETKTVVEGDYPLVCHEPCHVHYLASYKGGATHVVTIKGRTAG